MNKCIDIMDVKEFPITDMVYCDPPWEQGLVKMFETIMVRDSGRPAPNNHIDAILQQVGKLADKTKPVVIEYSVKNHERVINAMEIHGHKLGSTSLQLQGNNRPYMILLFNTNVKVKDYGFKGGRFVTEVMSLINPASVFDPFAGIGFTAKRILKMGINYTGYEINPARFKKLQKICGTI